MYTTAVKERPILFSGPMVRAILDGNKTQTRRVIKLREFGRSGTPGYDWTFRCNRGRWQDYRHDQFMQMRAPYWPGDVLWVREKWRPAGVEGRYWLASVCGDENHKRWRPSIHMPRPACQLRLEVTAIRVERLQEITETDAKAEGCKIGDVCARRPDGHVLTTAGTRKVAFEYLWDSINGKRYPWASNPWVWVIEFKRMKGG
jgi:hypothetical protein